jgi:predicted Zn-dependent protease
METSGRQPGTPSPLCASKGRKTSRARGRTSIPFLVSTFMFLMALLAAPRLARAQQQGPGSGMPDPGFPSGPSTSNSEAGNPAMHDSFDAIGPVSGMMPLIPVDNSRLINAESCETWTAAAVNSPTVSVTRLDVPSKASHEFQKACGDLKGNKLKSAEEHARKAVKIYPDYAAAWVILGQILHAEHQDREAIEACHTSKRVDPNYAPPYICLAEFSARANDWDEAYSLANQALSLEPATNPYAFLLTATADFHLKRMEQAELYALSAEKLDKWHRIPDVHILLAQLYEVKGDRTNEASELRKYIKFAPHNSHWDTAKAALSKIEDEPAK